MKKNTYILIAICFLLLQSSAFAQINTLRADLEKIISSFDGKIGLALMHIENGDTLSINDTQKFPMQSVYKLPLALTVLKQVDEGKLNLEQKISVKAEELNANTWSPFAKKFPNQDIDVSIAELLEYSVGLSDNLTSIILIKNVGGIEKVENYIHSLGYQEIAIKLPKVGAKISNELYEKLNVCTPSEFPKLLKNVFNQKYLSKSTNDFLIKTLIEAQSGPKRIKGLLPKNATVAHKTGTGDRAVNDVGIIYLPNGKHIALAVFVDKQNESFDDAELVIAKLSKAIYDYYEGK